jgi:endonuclease/exonuclease/phosphatase family metal-dependent hydrolase
MGSLTGSITVVTANLLHGMALNGQVRADDLRVAVAALGADVLAVQEVDRHQRRTGGTDQPALIAEATGLSHWRFLPSVLGTPGPGERWRAAEVDDGAEVEGPAYGVALFSRWPVREWRVLRFTPSRLGLPLKVADRPGLTLIPDEPRLALAAVLDQGPDGVEAPWTVATTHLSFVPVRNVWQLRRVTAWLADLPGPRLLLGDLNLPGVLPQRTTGWWDLARLPTYPSWKPRIQWDHVLADGDAAPLVHGAEAVDLGLSDHLALRVDVDLADAARRRAALPAAG